MSGLPFFADETADLTLTNLHECVRGLRRLSRRRRPVRATDGKAGRLRQTFQCAVSNDT